MLHKIAAIYLKMERGYSYSTYDNLSYALPIGFILLAPTSMAIICLQLYLWVRFCFKGSVPDYIWTAAFKILKQVYGDELQKENEFFTLYGRKLSKFKVVLLLQAVMMIFFCVLVSFWSELLVNQSNICNNQLDCFALNSTDGGLVQFDPLSYENCTEFQEDDYKIECYSFAFDYIEAVGNSGGVLIVGGVIMTTQAGLVAGLVTLKEKSKQCGKYASIFLLLLHLVTSSLVLLLLLFLLLVPTFQELIQDTKNTIVQFTAYYVTLLYTHILSVSVLFDLSWKATFNPSNDRNKERNKTI